MDGICCRFFKTHFLVVRDGVQQIARLFCLPDPLRVDAYCWLVEDEFLEHVRNVAGLVHGSTCPKFNSSPLKSYRNPIGKACLRTTIFQGRAVNLRGCNMARKSSAFHWTVGPEHVKGCHPFLVVKFSRPFFGG